MALQKIDNLLESAESHNISSPWWFIARELNKSLTIHMETYIYYYCYTTWLFTFVLFITYLLFAANREDGRRQQNYSSLLDRCLSSIVTGSRQCCRKKSSTHLQLLFPGLRCPLLAAAPSVHAATLCTRQGWPTLKLIQQKAGVVFFWSSFVSWLHEDWRWQCKSWNEAGEPCMW